MRGLKYASVSAVAVVVGQTLLFTFLEIAQWAAVPANVAAVTLSAIPSYILNRYWVWGKKSRNSFTTEVLPFWAMALLGLILSTVAVAWVDTWTDSSILIALANLTAFGVLWVAKYFVLDSLLFGQHTHERPAVESQIST